MTSAPLGPLPDPDDTIVAVMAGVEPDLDAETVRQAIAGAAPSQAKRRRLARALTDDADLLVSGRPEGAPVIGDFVRALLAHGSRRAVLPKCADCGSQKKLTGLRTDGQRICSPCSSNARAKSLSCVECSRPARIYRRTRTGEAICGNCWRMPEGDPIALTCQAITAIVPDAEPAAVRRAVESVTPDGQLHLMFRLLWEIEDTPGLLTGEGAKASARAARLISSLTAAGVAVSAPACHGCGDVRPLTHVLDGLRCCLPCYRKASSETCGRCGHDRIVAQRREDGTPLCSGCMRYEAHHLITCVLCDRIRPVGRRTKDGPLCKACYRPRQHICAFCGKGRAAATGPRPGCRAATSAHAPAAGAPAAARTSTPRPAPRAAICANPAGRRTRSPSTPAGSAGRSNICTATAAATPACTTSTCATPSRTTAPCAPASNRSTPSSSPARRRQG
ncbi:hypothetical protein [Streptomyces sp. Ac-502]|uniref:hypothetical protein n=1 Tax=Streptomyces sp. Ac-502 TaxID=3342801 RepID=UPI003862A5E1